MQALRRRKLHVRCWAGAGPGAAVRASRCTEPLICPHVPTAAAPCRACRDGDPAFCTKCVANWEETSNPGLYATNGGNCAKW